MNSSSRNNGLVSLYTRSDTCKCTCMHAHACLHMHSCVHPSMHASMHARIRSITRCRDICEQVLSRFEKYKASRRIDSDHITAQDTMCTTHHITSHHNTSHHIASHHKTTHHTQPRSGPSQISRRPKTLRLQFLLVWPRTFWILHKSGAFVQRSQGFPRSALMGNVNHKKSDSRQKLRILRFVSKLSSISVLLLRNLDAL